MRNSQREDGLILCKRPPNPPQIAGYICKGLAKDGQTAMYVVAGREYRGRAIPPPARVERPSVLSATLNETHTTAVAGLTPELRCALGVGNWVADSIPIENFLAMLDEAGKYSL